MKVRAFLAFEVSAAIRSELHAVIQDLKQYAEEIQWIAPQHFHVTMRYFGDVEEDLLLGPMSDTIESLVSGWQRTALDCGSLGVFPNWKYPRVIWAGFLGDTESILQWRDALDRSLSQYDLPVDARAFRLHLTLGRAKALKGKMALVKRIEALSMATFGELHIDRLTLFKSELTKDEPIYTPLKTFFCAKAE